MTVKELIQKLNDFDEDLVVKIRESSELEETPVDRINLYYLFNSKGDERYILLESDRAHF